MTKSNFMKISIQKNLLALSLTLAPLLLSAQLEITSSNKNSRFTISHNGIFKQGGTAAVLSEIGKLDSDYVKAAYANLLMKQNVMAKDYSQIISQVTSAISSDHYKTEFLSGGMSKFLLSKEATDAVFAAS